MQIKSARDLTVYKRAYELAMEIFRASKHFPAEAKVVKLKPGSISHVIAGICRNAIMHSSRRNAVRSERCLEALSRTLLR